MTVDNLKYLNAINNVTYGGIDIIENLERKFGGNWESAWVSISSKKKIDPEKAFEELYKNKIKLLTIRDLEYPPLLRQISHPPFLLYVRGSKEVLKSNCFGVVGTRALTDYGRRATPSITQEIVRGGFTIASGLAMGIDTLAHKAAIDGGGKTIAVLGCGVDDPTIFPPQNLKLAHKIIETGGAVISEFPFGMQGRTFTFPQRNRIVSGLSKGVLVIEADIQSGALITAKFATEQNRDLFCLPGSIYSRTSQGTNFMIQKGAKLVSTGADILEEYDIKISAVKLKIRPENEIEAKVLTLLTAEPLSSDDIIRGTGLETSKVIITLVSMEMNKKIKAIGNKFILFN